VQAPEEALVQAFMQARRTPPCVLFLPHAQLWWDTVAPGVRATLCSLLEVRSLCLVSLFLVICSFPHFSFLLANVMVVQDLPPELPVLLLAVSDVPASRLPRDFRDLFAPQALHALAPPGDVRYASFVLREMAWRGTFVGTDSDMAVLQQVERHAFFDCLKSLAHRPPPVQADAVRDLLVLPVSWLCALRAGHLRFRFL
jgi:hypothetical protein